MWRTLYFLLSLNIVGAPEPRAFGQTATAVSGRVTDTSGAVIPGASLLIRHKETARRRGTETQLDGRYNFENLEPGDYEIEVSSSGFRGELYNLSLEVGDHPTLNFDLQISELTETLEVIGTISGMNTTDSKVDGVVNRLQIANLPLNGRNFLELARLEPGVTVQSVANPGGFGNNYQRVSIAGAQYLATRVSVDGSTVGDRINGGTAQNFSQESVQEFQISTFVFDLATGTTGTGAVNIVTRRGGNDVHGSLFFYYRDSRMAAYPALRRDPDNPSPPFARRQSGFSLGGPLQTDRAYWFTNFEHHNQDGVFAVANGHPIFSKFDLVYPSPLDFSLFNARIDVNINSGHSALLRLSADKNNNIAPSSTGAFMPSNWQVSRSEARQIHGALTSVLTPALVSHLRFSHSYLDNYLDPVTDADCATFPACVGVGGPQIQTFDAPLFRIGHQGTVPKTMFTDTYQFASNLVWQRGAHRIRFGAELERLQLNSVHAFFEQPPITLWGPMDLQRSSLLRPMFDALPASLKDPTGEPPTIEDILQLPLRSFTMGIGNPLLPGPYNHEPASRPDLQRFYIEDGWRILPNLTFTSGLAYLRRTRIFNQDLERPSFLAPLLGGDLRPPRQGTTSLEPRVGVTWGFGENADTVIRAGGGLFHDELNFFNPFLERASIGPSGNGRVFVDGALVGLSFLSTPTDFSGQDLLDILPGIRSSITARFGDGTDIRVRGIEVIKQGDRIFDPGHTTPSAIHATAGFQRKLGSNFVLAADYVLRRLVHLAVIMNPEERRFSSFTCIP